MLQNPEDWESDLNEFLTRYTPRLHLFLEALRDCVMEQMEQGMLSESQRLSIRMEQSLENGLFWVCLAARSSSIDSMYYGDFTSIEDRIALLSDAIWMNFVSKWSK